MSLIIALFFTLSIISYVVIDRNVGKITKTPTLVLWTVLMSPAWIWLIWIVFLGEKSIPAILMIIPLIFSPLLYLWLIEWGKPRKSSTDSSSLNKQNQTKAEKLSSEMEDNGKISKV